jgi:hypothetical protein
VKKAFHMTRAEAEAHQRKHGFLPMKDGEIRAFSTDDTLPTKEIERIGNKLLKINDGMNKTEREYAMILEAQKRKGEIRRWEYEGITLRWADMRYTPDFLVFGGDPKSYRDWPLEASLARFARGLPLAGPMRVIYDIKVIEVKGAKIWDRDIVRFKGARAFWPEFAFEMWQKKAGQWNRLH